MNRMPLMRAVVMTLLVAGSLWLIFQSAGAADGPADPRGPETVYCAAPGLPIPDGDPGGVSHTINVPDSFTLGDLNVSVVASHEWVGDLIVRIEHVDTMQELTIIDRPGKPASFFGCDGFDIDATIDDHASDPVESECESTIPSILGDFIGGDPPNASLLAGFNGDNFHGDWKLTVVDSTTGYTGVLQSWCIEGNVAPPLPTPTNTPITPTNTPGGPTNTPTATPVPPTASVTPGGPTLTPTPTAVPGTPTSTPGPGTPTYTPPTPTGTPGAGNADGTNYIPIVVKN